MQKNAVIRALQDMATGGLIWGKGTGRRSDPKLYSYREGIFEENYPNGAANLKEISAKLDAPGPDRQRPN